MIREPLIFEISKPGKRAYPLPKPDVPEPKDWRKGLPLREDIPDFPEVSETEVVRHFTRLSKTNYCVDEGIYPLGSCTMKYNPKINERMAGLPGFTSAHPSAPPEVNQGSLEVIHLTERFLTEITGMHAFTLQPAAGAQGELTGMMLIRACLEDRGDPRKIVLIPDSAHGTNPSSAHISGYRVQEIKSDVSGTVDVEDLARNMNRDVAAVMITNPNTLGVFEHRIKEIAGIVHEHGGFVYMDGANMNALMGNCRPGDMDVDVIHLNLHKTFSTPHGGGGPGAGPVGVKRELEPYLPIPVILERQGQYIPDENRPKSIGKVKAFYGNFLVFVKALCYILSLGPDGLKEASDIAVLNANYIRKRLEGLYSLDYDTPTLHECVFSDRYQRESGITNLDVAKRLIDLGVHPPTMSFPLIVHGALMIEPTETESRRDLDLFVEAMERIAKEAKTNPGLLKDAPTASFVRRLDETTAARYPVLRWSPEDKEPEKE